jgi:GT2 family glycosyltransferase
MAENLSLDNRKKLSVIIINYKTASLLRQCIKSIQKNKPQKYDCEIIVVDNDSNDGSVEMIEDDFYSSVKLIANDKNLGFPKAVNQGVRRARESQYILLLNPDITVLPKSLDQMIDFMEENKSIAVLGPRLINPNGSIQNSCFNHYTSPRIVLYRRTIFGKSEKAKKEINKFLMADWNHKEGREVAWILGSCMLIRKEAIGQTGLMDERFFMYLEDVDWCRRFWQKGWKVYYYPKIKMVHYYQRASASESGLIRSILNRQTRIHIASAVKFFLKYWKNQDSGIRKPNLNA